MALSELDLQQLQNNPNSIESKRLAYLLFVDSALSLQNNEYLQKLYQQQQKPRVKPKRKPSSARYAGNTHDLNPRPAPGENKTKEEEKLKQHLADLYKKIVATETELRKNDQQLVQSYQNNFNNAATEPQILEVGQRFAATSHPTAQLQILGTITDRVLPSLLKIFLHYAKTHNELSREHRDTLKEIAIVEKLLNPNQTTENINQKINNLTPKPQFSSGIKEEDEEEERNNKSFN